MMYDGAGSRKRRMLVPARLVWRLNLGEPPAIQGMAWVSWCDVVKWDSGPADSVFRNNTSRMY